MAASPTSVAQPDDKSWIDHPTGMEGIPQGGFDAKPSKQELDPSEVEMQAPEKPIELSSDDVELQSQPDSQPSKQPADEDMTAPPAWAQKPGAVPDPKMRESALGKVAGAFSGVDMSPEEKAQAEKSLSTELADTPAARAGKSLTSGPVTLGRGLKDVYQAVNSGDPYEKTPTKEEQQQLLHGAAETAAGAVQTYTLGKAGELVELGPMVAAGSREAQVALLKFIGSIEVGAGASQGMDALAKHLGFSQGARELSDTVAQFLPQLIGVATATRSFASENAPIPGAPEGTTAYGVQTGGNRAGAVVTEHPTTGERTLHVKLGNATKNIPLPRNEVTTRPDVSVEPTPPALPGRQGPPPPPPDPAAVTAEKDAAAGIAAVQATAQSRTEAERVQQGQPPVPPPRQAPGMADGVIKPEVIADLGRIAEIVGPEHQADIVHEVHQTLTTAIAQQGTVVMPDGKVEVVDTPKKAATVAASIVNDQIDRQTKAKDEAAKVQQTAADSAQAAQTDQQTQLEQRAKTLLAANPDHKNPVSLLQRNLRLGPGAAQELLNRVTSPAEAQAAPLVGSATHAVTEEPPAQVDAQLDALKKGTVPVVMLPDGAKYEPELPPGMKKLTVSGDAPGAGTYIYDPRKIRPATIKEAAKAGTHGDLLGHVQTKEELAGMKEPVVLQARQNGQPVQESVVDGADHGALTAQHDQLADRWPGAEITAKTGEQVQQERKDQPGNWEEDDPRYSRAEKILDGYFLPKQYHPEDPYFAENPDPVPVLAKKMRLSEADAKAVLAQYIRDNDLNPDGSSKPKQGEANAVQKSETGEVLQQPHGQGEGGSKSGEGVQPGEQGHEVAAAGAEHPKEIDKAAVEKGLKDYQSKTRVVTFSEKLKPFLDADRAKAKPVNDIHGEPTGWLAHNHNDGLTIIHPNEPYAIDFSAPNASSGTESMRARAEAQSYAIDNPARDVFDQAAEKKAEPKGDVFDQVEKEAGDRRNAARESSVDRRQNTEQRNRVAQMSPEELRQELLTSHTVGLPNRRAFDEAQEENPAAAVGMSDADGLKAFNDKFGYEAGNALLKAKADALKEAGLEAYHDKGDEFLYRGDSEAALKNKLSEARAILRDMPIDVTMDDGTVKTYKGADFSYGTGTDIGAAESGLKQHKSEREAAGERARGELRGITEAGPEKGKEGASEAEHKYEFGSTQHNLRGFEPARHAIEALQDEIPEADLAGKGKDVDIPHVTVRYGLRGDSEGVRKFLSEQKPFKASLGAVDVFPPTKNSDGAAVVMAPVNSPELHAMNAEIAKHGDFKESDFPEYKPHVTIAYVKPEAAEKYRGNTETEGETFEVTHVFISDRDGNQTPVKLEGGQEPVKMVRLGDVEKPAKGKPSRSLVLPAGTNAKLGPEKTITVSSGNSQEEVTGPTVRFPGIRNEFVVHPAAFGSYEGEAWTVTEASTGLAVTTQSSRDIAIRSAEATLNHVGQQGLDAAAAKSGIKVVPTPTTEKEVAEKPPEQPGQEPATPVKKLGKGDAVTFTDAKGNEREGTVAHVNGIVTRIKGGDGKEYTVATRKVKASGEPAQSSASLDTSGAGRAPGAARELHPASVGEVSPEVREAAAGERGAGLSGAPDGASVRERPEPVSEQGTGSGPGQGSDTAVDRAEPGEVATEPEKTLADSPAAKPAAKAEKERTAPAPVRNRDWYSHPAEWKPAANESGRVEANLAALKLLREIEKEPRKLSAEERQALASYVGWGALPKVFDPYSAPHAEFDKWRKLNQQLRTFLSDDEFAAARRSTQNAHYTSPELVRFMWDVMKRFGFKGGNVLEPSMGTGNFFGMMPKAIRGNIHAIGNELDPTTFAIAQQLYPGATLYNKDFKDLILPDDDLDLAISNVPFGEALYDPKYPKLKARVHDYFFVKSLDKVKPGGVVAFITSTGTMDKANDTIRQILGSKADLLGAIRLPSSAFEKTAGTGVTTDLILLRKRAPGEQPKGPDWMKTEPMELKDRHGEMQSFPVNEFFHKYPGMMLGEPESHSMYGGRVAFSLKAFEDKPIAKLLDAAMQKLPRGILLPADPTGSKDAETGATYAPDSLKEGALTLSDKGKVMQRVHGKLIPAESVAGPDGAPVPAKVERAKNLIALRDQYDELLFDMANVPDDEAGNSEIAKAREKLLKSYQKFTKKFGELHRSPNEEVFGEDPHYARLLGLEHYDKAAKKTTLADVFTKRTAFPPKVLRALAPDPQDALNQILAERGYPDMNLMALLRGSDIATVAKEFIEKGLIYRDPLHGQYETRDKYLSGYVRDKLADARKAVAQGNKEYEANVAALEGAQPEDVPIHKIEVKLGATWIPLPAFRDFIRDTFNTEGSVTNTAGQWRVSKLSYNAEVGATYGTPRLDARELMEMALNLKEPTVYDYDGDKRILNAEETALARHKQEQIKEAFNAWTDKAAKWSKPLEQAYNYAMNNLVLRERDGSHLTLPGLNPAIKMRPHQLSIIWRGIEDGRYGAFHEVGAGKTLEAIATIMESRRMGLIHKAMLAVPNHLVEQWRNEFMHAYPGAKLLVPTKRDFEAKRRNRLMAKIASGDYDAVVLAHSQFNLMDISAERQLKTLNAQMDELEETIRAMRSGNDDARSVKQMEKSKEKLRARMDRLRDLAADRTINFDELGVDALFVDEAHEYKNLAFYTKMTRVSGLSQGDAKRALRLKMKTEYLQDKNKGKGVFFLTGTPLQNTMAEQYTMMKYVAPDVLEKAGIRFFDDWAANFGSVRAKAELGADGRSFKIRNKFSRFTNVPELMTMFHSFGDVKTARDLDLPVPKLVGGKPQSQIIEPSAALEGYVQSLIYRARQIAGEVGTKPDPTEDNMLKVTSDGRKAATDMRLVYPDAEDDPESKINRAVADVYEKWKEYEPFKGTQLLFLDMYRAIDGETGKELINLYEDMRNKWVKAGIPRDQIAIIGEFKTDEARQRLFDKVNAGDVRILLGSTQKMGAGMNVQKRLKWLHDLDNPWRPGDLAQRHGRIIRQGNDNEEVGITHWLTKNSFDTYMLQALESKANFIEQVMNGRYEGRTMEDITGDMSLNLAEMKVATSGNPDVKKKYDLESDRSQLLTLQRGHESQRRNNLQQAASSRSYAASERADQGKMRAALASIAEAKGEKGDGFKAQLDGKSYTDREEFGKAIEKMEVPAANFHMELNGIGIVVEPFDAKNLPQMRYNLSYDNRYFDAPERTMQSLVLSVEARLARIEDRMEASLKEEKSRELKAAKLDELAKVPFDKQAEIDRIEAEIKEVNQRLGIGPKKDVSEIAEADNTPDELEEGEDNDDVDLSEPRPKKGTELRASLFGLDIAAEFLGKQAAAFWRSDAGPALEKAGKTAKAAGKYIAEIVYPRFNANEDALDSIMAAKGEMERSRFLLEHINGGMERFFDKMTLDQHLAFIDRYKLGVGQPEPELQKAEDLMRAIDDASLKLAQQFRPNLTAKENHFRVLWKVIPNSKAPGPQNAPGGNPTNFRRPYEGDKGFMKRATLDTISEGINYGGVPYTTNPWKLFTMAQASIKKYIAAQEHWANVKKLGLRKFVALHDAPPPGWATVDDRIGDVYFKADSGEGSVHAGRWFLEPSTARILNNFLSRDLIRENPVGNALLLAKNLTTALSLSLSPFHFLFETLEAMGSQIGVGSSRFWNVAARKGDYGQGLLALREMGSFMAAPVLYARAGGSLIRATSDFHSFAQTKRGQAFLTQYPDAIHHLDLYFKGGGQFNMNPDYRTDLTKSFRQAIQENNYVGAAVRIVPALGQAIMHPLFQVYIPRLKMGFFLAQNAMKQLDFDKELANGETTELALARQVVDATENRFGELNFSNLFWNNTFKSVMQFAFRSVTWKLGNWRGAGVAGAEGVDALRDPLRAMWEDAKAGKARPDAREEYLPRIGINMAWLIGMGTVATILGTLISKALSGKMPWEWAGEDKRNADYSLPGSVLLEMMHPRTGRRDPRTGLPERVTLPIGLKDFEHAIRDPKGYLEASESDLVSRMTDLARNRDFFGNYVYDPNGPLYQQAADALYYVVPKPMALEGFTQHYGAQDMTSKVLRAAGVGSTSKSLDQTKLEREMIQSKRDKHDPMTPEQVRARDAEDHMHRHVSIGTLRRHIRESRMSEVERLAEGMSYAELKRMVDRDATPHEKRLLSPMLVKKRQNLLRKDGYSAVQTAER